MIRGIAKYAAAAGVLALAAAFSSVAAQDEDQPLAPTSPWNMRYDEDKCRLVREFGGADGVALMIDQTGPEPFYTLTLIGSNLRKINRKAATLQFGPNEAPQRRSFLYGTMPNGKRVISLYGTTLAPVEKTGDGEVVAIGPEREAAITTFSIGRSEDWETVELAIGRMAAPLDALRTCVEDLQSYLEIDADSGDKPPTPANSPGDWLNSWDYPRSMMTKGDEGVVSFRLTVDKEGKPTACQIAASTRPQTFDDVVCHALLQRAQFNPATDGEGNPRPAYYTGTVQFQIG